MAGKRSYDDGCAAAHALDLVGERWALLVVRELVLGPRRFTDLRAGLPGISPNVLTQRLEELEQGSVVRRRKLPPPAASWVYELTEWGAQLEGVLWKSVRTDALPTELVLRWQAQRAGALSALDEDAIDGPARRGRGLPVVNVVSP